MKVENKDIYILGLNAYHGDSSACLLKNGEVVAALEEERIRRVKHWAGFPGEAIKFCLASAGIGPKDLTGVAINRDPWARLSYKIIRLLSKRISGGFIKSRLTNLEKIKSVKTKLAEIYNLEEKDLSAKVFNVEHHLAHLVSAFAVSPFTEAALVSVDGFGDFASTLTAYGTKDEIKKLGEVRFPHSLGIFYTALTQFLGFNKYGDEYKVMGLSAAGKPLYVEKIKKLLILKQDDFFELDASFFMHDSSGVEMTWLDGEPSIGKIFSNKMEVLLGPARQPEEPITDYHKDLAASVQAVYEEVFFRILNEVQTRTGSLNLCLAGGCAQNSLANGKIYEKTKFINVYIPPAAHDAGGAVGAAMQAHKKISGGFRGFVMESPFWGSEYTVQNYKAALTSAGLNFKELPESELLEEVSKAIADGQVIGWFQGRTEWGPRALGNRSILANPARLDMKDILNLKIKRRESFRPFAPSILADRAGEYFERTEPVPFMEKVYLIKENQRVKIPAVTHLDGTGRLQTVSEKTNPLYYRLIKKVGELTGVPMVLNTSFNENEPIVNKPEEAINCFLRTKMDVLVLGSLLITR